MKDKNISDSKSIAYGLFSFRDKEEIENMINVKIEKF